MGQLLFLLNSRVRYAICPLLRSPSYQSREISLAHVDFLQLQTGTHFLHSLRELPDIFTCMQLTSEKWEVSQAPKRSTPEDTAKLPKPSTICSRKLTPFALCLTPVFSLAPRYISIRHAHQHCFLLCCFTCRLLSAYSAMLFLNEHGGVWMAESRAELDTLWIHSHRLKR